LRDYGLVGFAEAEQSEELTESVAAAWFGNLNCMFHCFEESRPIAWRKCSIETTAFPGLA
jgi:hypothetical protein